MNTSRTARVFLVFSCFITSLATAAPDVTPGLWKMSTRMEMPGLPMKMPAVSYKKCFSGKDVVPQTSDTKNNCKMGKSSIKGDTITWHMECDGQSGPATFDGKASFRGKTMKGVVNVNQSGQSMLQHISGQWVGQCE